MPELRITIPEALDAKIEAAIPEYLDRKGFLCLLIDQVLTGGCNLPAYRVGAGTQEGLTDPDVQHLQAQQGRQPAACEGQQLPPAPQGIGEALEPKKNKSKNIGSRFVFSVPPDLEPFKAELLDYWRNHKSGKKSPAAARILISGIRKIRDNYGDKAVTSQIELACGYGWENITLANYEKFGLPVRKPGASVQPEFKHPAAREFRGGRFVDDDGPTTNPVLKDLF